MRIWGGGRHIVTNMRELGKPGKFGHFRLSHLIYRESGHTMAFQAKGEFHLDFLFGGPVFQYGPNRTPETFRLESSDYGKIFLEEANEYNLTQIVIRHANQPILDTKFIIDFSAEKVWYRDINGQIHSCAYRIHNQGALFSMRWEASEDTIFWVINPDNPREVAIGDKLDDLF